MFLRFFVKFLETQLQTKCKSFRKVHIDFCCKRRVSLRFFVKFLDLSSYQEVARTLKQVCFLIIRSEFGLEAEKYSYQVTTVSNPFLDPR